MQIVIVLHGHDRVQRFGESEGGQRRPQRRHVGEALYRLVLLLGIIGAKADELVVAHIVRAAQRKDGVVESVIK